MARNPYLDTYEGYFGDAEPFDPIDTSPFATPKPRRGALPVYNEGDPDSAQNDMLSLIDESLAGARAPAPAGDDGVSALDYGKALGAGTLGVGSMIAGAGEYAAGQVGADWQAEFFGDVRRGIGKGSQWLMESMTPEAQERIARNFLTLDPEKSVWRGGLGETLSSVGLKLSQTLPSSAVTLLPAIRFFKAGMTPGAITWIGASEGGLSLGGIASGIAEEIEGMEYEELYSESDRFRQLMGELNDEDAARRELIQEAQGVAPVVGGVLVGAIGATAGRFLEPVITGTTRNAAGELVQKGAGLLGRAGKGFLAEAPQEGTQSPAETIAQNYAAQAYDSDRTLTEGAAEAAAEGTILGGLLGGGFTAVGGARPTPPQPEPQPQEPPAGFTGPIAPRDRGEPFEDVFGQGGQAPQEGTADWLPPIPSQQREEESIAELDAAWDERFGAERALEAAQAQLKRAEINAKKTDKASERVQQRRQTKLKEARARVKELKDRLGQAVTTINTTEVDVDVASAAANIRRDDMMDDLFQTEPQDQLVRQDGTIRPSTLRRREDPREIAIRNEQLPLTGGIDTDPRSGRDLSPSRDFTRKLAGPAVPEEMAGQQEFLPFPGPRRRGVGRTTEKLGGTAVPTQLPTDGEINATIDGAFQEGIAQYRTDEEGNRVRVGTEPASPVPYAQRPGQTVATPDEVVTGETRTTTPEERYQAGQEDMFREEAPPVQRPTPRATTAAEAARARTERPFVLRVTDNDGAVISEEQFDTAEEANTWQEFYYENYPNYNYTITRPPRAAMQTKSGTSDLQTIRQVQESETTDQRTERGPSPAERTQTDVARRTTMDERSEIPRGRRAPTSTGKAAARLVGEQVREAREAETRRIGGFYNPKDLTFKPRKNPKGEITEGARKAAQRLTKRYKDAWGALVDAEITIEASEDAATRQQAKLIKDAALEELARVRTMGKPVRDTKKLQTASRIEPAVRQDLEKETAGRPTLTPEEAEVEQYVQRTADVEAPDTLLNLTDARIEDLRKRTNKDEEQAKTVVDDLFEQAVQYQAGLAKNVRKAIKDQKRGARKVPTMDERIKELKALDDAGTINSDQLRELNNLMEAKELERQGFAGEQPADEGTFADRVTKITGDDAKWGDIKDAEEQGVIDLPDFDPMAFSGMEDVGIGNIAEKTRSTFSTPGQRLKFIQRMRASAVRAEAGGKQGGATVTAAASQAEPVPFRTERFETEKKADKFASDMAKQYPTALIDIEAAGDAFVVSVRLQRQAVTESRYETTPALAEVYPQDESAPARKKREARAKAAKKELKAKSKAALQHVKKVNKDPEFLSELGQQDNTGRLTRNAADRIAGRAYFLQMIQYADALAAADKTTAAAAQQMEQIAAWLDKHTGLSAKQFSKKMAQMFRAQGRESRKSLPAATKITRDTVRSEDERLRTIAATNERIETRMNYIRRYENQWQSSSLYRNNIRPIINAFHYDPMYNPTPQELENIKYSMDKWLNDSYEDFYKPLKPLLADFGIQFAPKAGYWVVDENQQFKVVPKTKVEAQGYSKETSTRVQKGEVLLPRTPEGDAYFIRGENLLSREYTKMFGDAPDVSTVLPMQLTSMEQVQAQQRRIRATRESEQSTQAALRYARINGAIQKLQDRIAPAKVTIDGLVKAEEAFIKRMQELGAWTQVSPKMGKIDLGFGKTKTYRIAGDRLLSKELKKQEAKNLMTKISPATLTKTQQAQVDAVLQTTPEDTRRIGERMQDAFDEEAAPLLEALDLVNNEADYRDAANAAAAPLNDRTAIVTAGEVLGPMLEHLPKDSPWYPVARRMYEMGMDDVTISYDWTGQLSDGEQGKFFSRVYPGQGEERFILINPRVINEVRKSGGNVDAVFIHTVLHEMSHAATIGELERNPQLRNAMIRLQQTARKEFEALGIKLPYGLRKGDPVREFVAEAFTNIATQRKMKQVRVRELADGRTFWGRFVDLIKSVFNWGDSMPDNLLEATLMTGDQLFTGVARGRWGLTTAALEVTDDYVKPKVTDLVSRLDQSSTAFRNVRRRAQQLAARGLRAPLGALTMEQLRDTYKERFQDAGDNTMMRYVSNFFQRNSYNAQLMEEGETLSREWTKLQEQDIQDGTTNAIDMSYSATFSTLYQVSPTEDITAEANSHLKTEKAKERYYEARRLYDKLSDPAKEHYKRIREYYRKTIRLESSLVTSNALRGVLTKADGAPLDETAFEQDFTPEKIQEMTPEELEAKIGQYMTEAETKEIIKMRNVPQQYKGDYFPLSRYGDFVVFGRQELETKKFSDADDAYAFAADKRQGDPTLDVNVKKDGNAFLATVTLKDFRKAESFSDAEEAKRLMQEDYPGMTISSVQRQSAFKTDAVIQTNSALQSILGTLKDNKAAQQAIKEFYLKSLGDQSFRKHELKRKQRRGVDFHLQHRNFTNYAKSSSYYIAQLRYGWRMADALGDMGKFIERQEDTELGSVARLGDIHRELIKRDDNTVRPLDILHAVRRGTELGQFMMLTSPSYWMINATQPWLVSMPWMAATYGWKTSGASLARAQKLIAPELLSRSVKSKAGLAAFMSKIQAEKAFNVLDEVIKGIEARDPKNAGEYKSMLEELKRHSVIDLSWIAELRDIAEGGDLSMLQKGLDASRIMAHLTEVNNRILTSIAAYDLKKQQALAGGATNADAAEQATEYAKIAVSTTQFNYSAANKPRWFQPNGPMGALSPLVFQFMQWPQHMYYMMISNTTKALKGDREAMRVLANVSATHLAVGGVLGWMLQPIKVAIGLLMAGLDPDDDEWTLANALSGESMDRWTERFLADVFGTEVGGVFSRGLPSALGTDLSDRMSLGTLYFLDFRSGNAESVLGSMMMGFGGPIVSIGANAFKGTQDMLKGDFVRGVERMSPKMAKDLLKAARYMNEGLVNNAGDTMIPAEDIGPWDLFLQSLGFNISEVSEAYRKQSVIQGVRGSVRNKRQELLKEYRGLDPSQRGAFWQKILEFNREYPQEMITYETALRSLQGQIERESQFRRYGATISDEEALAYGERADYIP